MDEGLSVLGDPFARRLGQAFEEIADRRLQTTGDLVELAGADAIGAALVFLDLLEGKAQILGQPLLADAQKLPAHSNTRANMKVDGIGAAFGFQELAHAHA